MIITAVQYGRVVNLGNHEQERLSATAAVQDGETADDAMQKLRAWVDAEADTRRAAQADIEAALTRLSSLKFEKTEMERQVGIMRDTWNKARRFLQTVGLDLPESYGLGHEEGEMPF